MAVKIAVRVGGGDGCWDSMLSIIFTSRASLSLLSIIYFTFRALLSLLSLHFTSRASSGLLPITFYIQGITKPAIYYIASKYMYKILNIKEKKIMRKEKCQKWDSNPHPHKWTRMHHKHVSISSHHMYYAPQAWYQFFHIFYIHFMCMEK